MRHNGHSLRDSAQRAVSLRERAHALIPGGCHTYAKGDDQYPILAPGFIARGAGCRAWDTDGREYIEYGMGNRTVGLGHAYGPVVRAAQQELARGSNFTRPSPIEVACAEQFLALIDGAEMVKFCKDGSDATSGAVRLARAYTGRDLIGRCADHPFFSVDDWFIGSTPMNAGIPEQVQKLTLTFPYGDLVAVRALFEGYPGRIAALILEAARTEDPPAGYLHGLRDLCHANGALLILDEMITGFRWHNGGAQELYGITPDLSTFGKALANGFSLAGRRELMRLGGLDHQSMTHLRDLLATMPWWLLEPDLDHSLLTDGLGPKDDRAVAGSTANGSLAIIYIPDRAVTVDLAQLVGPDVAARWYDPANGSFAAVEGSPFPTTAPRQFSPEPGNNSSGSDDWVLVLESPA